MDAKEIIEAVSNTSDPNVVQARMAAKLAEGEKVGAAKAKLEEANAKIMEEAEAAFVKAQASFDPIVFDKENPHFKSKYASLTAVLKATRPHLNANGIGIRVKTRIEGEDIVATVKLVYKGVVFDTAEWPVGKKATPPQQLGSANTYGKRYAITDILCVAADDDDDGNAAQGKPGAGEPLDKAQAAATAAMGF